MATWHQMQARKRPGFRLYHDTKWTVLFDPPHEMSSAILFKAKPDAQAYCDRLEPARRRHCIILAPAKEG